MERCRKFVLTCDGVSNFSLVNRCNVSKQICNTSPRVPISIMSSENLARAKLFDQSRTCNMTIYNNRKLTPSRLELGTLRMNSILKCKFPQTTAF